MKLKKIFALMLSILFVAVLSAQTKKIATNKDKVEVKQKNQETDKKEMVKEETNSNTPNSVVAE